jgi:cell wall-associated NlpC family hydrolase
MTPTQEVIAKRIVARADSYVEARVPYRFGAEANADTPEPPRALDCSEMIERIFRMTQGAPALPDGSRFQAACRKTRRVSVTEALRHPGALLFVSQDGTNAGVHHVGLSAGDGSAIEANGSIGRVIRRVPKRGYWSFGALVKGLHY